MRYIDHNGENGVVRVGENVAPGTAFAVITLTYEDVADPHFLTWFLSYIQIRFIGPRPTH